MRRDGRWISALVTAASMMVVAGCGAGSSGGDGASSPTSSVPDGGVVPGPLPEPVDQRSVPDDVCAYFGVDQAELESLVGNSLEYHPSEVSDPANGSCNRGASSAAGDTNYNVELSVHLIAHDQGELGSTVEERVDWLHKGGWEEVPLPDDLQAQLGEQAVLLATMDHDGTELVAPVDEDYFVQIGLGAVSVNDSSYEQDIVPLTLDLVPLIDPLAA